MKKSFFTTISIVLCFLCVLALTGCKKSTPKEALSFTPNYNEQDWVNSIAKTKNNNVNFAVDGHSDFIIVYPDALDIPVEIDSEGKINKADDDKIALNNAVNFLKESLKKIVGCEFEAISKSGFGGGAKLEIVINELDERLINDGYGLLINDNEINIIGASLNGAENGIYSFLEKYLGCMFVTQDYDYLPNLPNINFEKTDTFHNPDMVWRMVYANESNIYGATTENNIKWNQKLKLNGAGMSGWGNWCHTFYTYIPPQEFFDSNPEYFSEYKGKRGYEQGPVSGQLCLTNENVYRIISERLFAKMEANPDMRYWDVSQMDTWINKGTGCTCKECKKIDDKEGSPMGSLLTFINRLADECAIKFSENFISTLAYNYSVKPPKNIKPRDNVIIKLCFMPGDVTSDISNPRSKYGKDANKILLDWSKITKNLLIWDYNINFHQYLMPYPIFSALQVNNDFYLDNNVYGVFHQMDYDKGGNSAELSAYVFAQIMWDRNANVKNIINKYFSVYYGAAAEPMAEYYTALENNAYKANRPLYIYSRVSQNSFDYLSIKNIDNYLEMFDKAEKLADGDEELLARIYKTKIGVLYVKSQELSFNKKERLSALKEFKSLRDANGIHSLYEGNPKGDNEVLTFYNKQLTIINAIPWILTAILIGSFSLITGTTAVVIKINKKIRKKKANKIVAKA